MNRFRRAFGLAVVVAPLAGCAAGTAGTEPAVTTLSRTAAPPTPSVPVVVPAPALVLQFSVNERIGPRTPVSAVVHERDGQLRFDFMACNPQAPACTLSEETVPGRLTSDRAAGYRLHARTRQWTFALSATSATPMNTLMHRCSYPQQGTAVEIVSKQHERLTWTGTVKASNGRPVELIGCNYNVRSGTVRFTTPAL